MILAPLFGTVTSRRRDHRSTASMRPAKPAYPRTKSLRRRSRWCARRPIASSMPSIADPRYGGKSGVQLGDLIVDSMPSCLTPVRAMIDAYDRYYGDGSGEAFFMGPYLDLLPKAVIARPKNAAQ